MQLTARLPTTRPSTKPFQACKSTRRVAVNRAIRADFDPDNASILVAGGGGVALSVTRKLKDMGSWVWQLQRTDVRRKEIEGMMAIVAKGDALNPADIEKAFVQIDGCDAVITSLGGTTANPEVDSQGNINLIEAAARHGVKKFILVTSIGAGESKAGTPEQVYETLKPVLLEKEKAEAKLKELAAANNMDFVIIRPGGLKSEPATGNGVLTESAQICGGITREDVADLVCKALRSDKSNGKTFSAVDKTMVFPGMPEYEVFTL